MNTPSRREEALSKKCPTPRYTVGVRRIGTVHIVRFYAVLKDGVEIDFYEDRSLAQGYCDYMNNR